MFLKIFKKDCIYQKNPKNKKKNTNIYNWSISTKNFKLQAELSREKDITFYHNLRSTWTFFFFTTYAHTQVYRETQTLATLVSSKPVKCLARMAIGH